MRTLHTILLPCVCFFVLFGCNADPQRQAVQGLVNLNGKPLPSGYISFRPVESTGGPTAGAEIHEGVYHIDAESGVFPGTFRVEITASRPGGDLVLDELTGKKMPAFRQYLPPRFNTKSTLTAQVAESGGNSFTFELKTTNSARRAAARSRRMSTLASCSGRESFQVVFLGMDVPNMDILIF